MHLPLAEEWLKRRGRLLPIAEADLRMSREAAVGAKLAREEISLELDGRRVRSEGEIAGAPLRDKLVLKLDELPLLPLLRHGAHSVRPNRGGRHGGQHRTSSADLHDACGRSTVPARKRLSHAVTA
jgi:hypothetical protein